jgi:hypothetical protein
VLAGRHVPLSALAAAALVAVSNAYLLVGRIARYATVSFTAAPARAAAAAVVLTAGALVFERAVRGGLYAALRARLHAGLAAPAVALLGAVVTAAVRLGLEQLELVPRGRAPVVVLVAHAYLVETLLGLGLAWLALGSGSTLPGGVSLSLVFVLRVALTPVYHGGVVPLLEVVFALLAAVAVAGVLAGPLAPHRAAVIDA